MFVMETCVFIPRSACTAVCTFCGSLGLVKQDVVRVSIVEKACIWAKLSIQLNSKQYTFVPYDGCSIVKSQIMTYVASEQCIDFMGRMKDTIVYTNEECVFSFDRIDGLAEWIERINSAYNVNILYHLHVHETRLLRFFIVEDGVQLSHRGMKRIQHEMRRVLPRILTERARSPLSKCTSASDLDAHNSSVTMI